MRNIGETAVKWQLLNAEIKWQILEKNQQITGRFI
jgi:hypothetical protein